MIDYLTRATLGGYALAVTYMADMGYDLRDDEDVRDAIVELNLIFDGENMTDEEIESALGEIRMVQATLRKAYAA